MMRPSECRSIRLCEKGARNPYRHRRSRPARSSATTACAACSVKPATLAQRGFASHLPTSLEANLRHWRTDRRGERLLQCCQCGILRPSRRILYPASIQGDPADPPRDLERQLLDFRRRRRGQRCERQASLRGRNEEAVGQDAVEMRMQIERSAETLHEGDGSRPAIPYAHRPSSAPLPGEEGAQEGPRQPRQKIPIHCQREAQGPGECQDPLAVSRLLGGRPTSPSPSLDRAPRVLVPRTPEPQGKSLKEAAG